MEHLGGKQAPCFARSTPGPTDEEPSVPRRHSSFGTAPGITAQAPGCKPKLRRSGS